MHENFAPPWFFTVFAIGFPVLWCASSYLIASLSGWHSLAKRWRATEAFRGYKVYFCSGSMRWAIGYNNCLILGADAVGLSMAVLIPFRLGHPTLFIPWEAITISPENRGLFFRKMGFELDRENNITLWLYERTARSLLAQQSRLVPPTAI